MEQGMFHKHNGEVTEDKSIIKTQHDTNTILIQWMSKYSTSFFLSKLFCFIQTWTPEVFIDTPLIALPTMHN